ncbi:MAG: hypothetical protein ACTJHK_05820 [Enterococcus viikkiensis]|uniref:Uncharacterized protein n=1 Tax=Enterococcus viikkiensis TaxID=930854 RepID=A0ABU3FSC6_9ENTE|nr:hypothetical protein [Enterococcus viikkiensis]MDT2828890.1 hypothetical protein [Enterococcus viikkiensis]
MKAKDLLTAIQVDAAGELKKLSTYAYVFVRKGEKETNQLVIQVETDRIVLKQQANTRLTLNQFIKVLNESKEADIYLNEELIFGYRLVEEGILLG